MSEQTEEPTRRARARQWWDEHGEAIMRHASWIVPLILYISLLSFEVTVADGPEFLVAIENWSVAHPSGYPLVMLLGQLAKLIPLGTRHFNVSLLVSAIPAALTAWVLWETLRKLDIRGPTALITSWAYAVGERVMFQATRIEVYALHGLFLMVAFYALLSYAQDRDNRRWLYGATLAVCLGLTNHLTSAFMVPIVILFALTVDFKGLFTPRTIAICLGIAAACASLYAYIPLAASYQHEALLSPSWNDVRSWDQFVYHVTGEEYNIHRGDVQLIGGIDKLGTDLQNKYFPGIGLIAILGFLEMLRRHWRSALATGLFYVVMAGYISSYNINDIATYYPAAFLVLLLWVGVGLEWLLRARFDSESVWARWLERLVWVGCIVGCGFFFWRGRVVGYDEQYGGDMSAQAIKEIPERTIVFTDVDRHTFTMWYQAYMAQPHREVIPVSTSLFSSHSRVWYRDFLRRRYPQVEWPDEKQAKRSDWKRRFIKANRDEYNFYAFPWKRWKVPGTAVRNHGWVHEIIDLGPGVKDPHHGEIRYIHMSEHAKMQGRHVFWNSESSYPIGKKLTCLVSWYNDHKDVTGSWVFDGPNGERVEYPKHNVPPSATLSWEFLPKDKQVPGEWTCTVTFPGMDPLVRTFTIEE